MSDDKTKTESRKTKDPERGKTDVPGQNPKQDDAPDHDVHHDENRSGWTETTKKGRTG